MKESIKLKDVYAITERELLNRGGKRGWTKVGIGFVNRDDSISIVLDALPLTGRLHVCDRETSEYQKPSASARRATAR